jgi:hypothetical protein
LYLLFDRAGRGVSAAEVGSGVGVVARDLLAILAPLVPVLEDVGLGVRRLGAHAHRPNPRPRLRLLRRGRIAQSGRAQVGTVGEDGVQRAGQPPVLLAHPPQLLLETLGLSVGKQWPSATAILMREWVKGTTVYRLTGADGPKSGSRPAPLPVGDEHSPLSMATAAATWALLEAECLPRVGAVPGHRKARAGEPCACSLRRVLYRQGGSGHSPIDLTDRWIGDSASPNSRQA